MSPTLNADSGWRQSALHTTAGTRLFCPLPDQLQWLMGRGFLNWFEIFTRFAYYHTLKIYPFQLAAFRLSTELVPALQLCPRANSNSGCNLTSSFWVWTWLFCKCFFIKAMPPKCTAGWFCICICMVNRWWLFLSCQVGRIMKVIH